MIQKLVYPVWMLVFVALAIVRRDVVLSAAAGALALVARALYARAWLGDRGRLAVANLFTLLRLAVVAVLPFLFLRLPRTLFAALVVLLLIADGLDGKVARARGEVSEVGAVLDAETDALTVIILALLLWANAGVGAWVLAAGLWRYVHALGVALWPPLGELPPTHLYRWIFGLVMLSFAGAFLPGTALARPCAAIGTILVSFSFLHSILRSRAGARGSAPP